MMKTASLILSAAFLSTSLSFAGGDGWMHDFEAAKKKATAEKKDLIIDFTGSDWCGWCIRLNKEVFQHDPFKKGVADKYVLVELDFPNDKSKLSPETIAQNQMLQEKYQVQGFPTILITDAQGRPYAQTGYQEGGPEAYLKHLGELQKNKTSRDEAFAKAEKAEGVAKAKALFAGLKEVPEDYRSHYGKLIEEIKSLDPKDETGLGAAEKAQKAMMSLEKGLQSAMQAGESEKALKLVDAYIADQKPEGEKKQEILAIKINILLEDGNFEDTEKVLDEIVAIAPESELSKMVATFKKTQFAQMKADAAKKGDKKE